MFKVVFFLWRRADFSRAQFIDYYENSHANLTKHDGTDELLVPKALDYRRNFPIWRTEQHPVFDGPHFDVMTEMWFNRQSEFEEQLKTVTTSPGKERISADEAKFLDRARQALFIVTECATEISHADDPLTKIVRFGQRQPQVSRQQFGKRYERAARDFSRQISGLVEHRRSYPMFEHPLSFQGGHHNQTAPDDTAFPLDLVEEFWLRKGADISAMNTTVQNASEGLLDQPRSPIVPVEEFRSPWGRPAAPGWAHRLR
ncbi:EthD domain-containing protein [Amycolatopsis sp.]|jgi:hypothetical protein|uniref:EthD domain-containing protein n=1 Tax=Amycolatopsis sp. TaxID=37632 RepID=UPI002E02D028|nr:EthD domain-containing protein [Amycolatopsis sp.]